MPIFLKKSFTKQAQRGNTEHIIQILLLKSVQTVIALDISDKMVRIREMRTNFFQLEISYKRREESRPTPTYARV